MPARGKPGNPTPGFPPFPPPLEIAARFPHFHTHDDSLIINREHRTHSEKLLPMSSDRSVTYVPGRSFRLISVVVSRRIILNYTIIDSV
jgi:hypothetical protein